MRGAKCRRGMDKYEAEGMCSCRKRLVPKHGPSFEVGPVRGKRAETQDSACLRKLASRSEKYGREGMIFCARTCL